MAKLAESYYTYVFAASERINWTIDEVPWGPNEIPVLFPAEKGGLAPPKHLGNYHQNESITRNITTQAGGTTQNKRLWLGITSSPDGGGGKIGIGRLATGWSAPAGG